MPTPLYKEVPCRVCGGDLDSILHLGDLVLPDYLPSPDAPIRRAPLDWCACAQCSLVQLRHAVDMEQVCRTYHYRSGVNEVMRAELADVVAKATALVGGLTSDDAVLDIGANDGTLLAAYPTFTAGGPVRIAIEPARNFRADLQRVAEGVITDFFPLVGGPSIGGGEYKIITSIATVYAAPDPHAYLDAVAHLLHPEGVWVVQFQDLAQMLQRTAFDNICVEHQWYPCLADMERLLADHGLVVTDAEVRAINGGSYRLYVRHVAGPWVVPWVILPSVYALRQQEAGCQSWDRLEDFAWRVEQARQHITALVDHTVQAGATVDLYAASTKSSTLLQYCGLTAEVLRQAWERTPEKVGRFTAGTDIPIVSEEAGRADPPQALLMGAWGFREAFLEREHEYLRAGGRFIVPLPACEIVEGRR